MAQADYNLENQKGAPFRAELNNILLSIATQNAGATEPAVTFAFMTWADTSSDPAILKIRNAANTGWVVVGELSEDNLGLALASAITGKVSKSVAGSADVSLSADDVKNGLVVLTGTLTGNINVIVPNAVNRWVVQNSTSGAFSVTVKTAAGSGEVVLQGRASQLICDGSNVIAAIPNLPNSYITSSKLADGAATGSKLGADVVVLSGTQTMTGQKVPKSGALTDAANVDWDGNTNGQVVTLTTAAARTINGPTNIQQNALYLLLLTTGGFTPAWNAAFKWPAGSAPSDLASGTYVFTFVGGAGNTMIPTSSGYLTGA